jgi:hypothetical protein
MVSEDEDDNSRTDQNDRTAHIGSDEEQLYSDDPDSMCGISAGEQEDCVTESSDKGTVQVKDGPPCDFCAQVPCNWKAHGDDIHEICGDLKDSGMDNNQVQFHTYHEYTGLKHGVLCQHDCRPLTMCVTS